MRHHLTIRRHRAAFLHTLLFEQILFAFLRLVKIQISSCAQDLAYYFFIRFISALEILPLV